jgi:SAM-dependent methyltransferase
MCREQVWNAEAGNRTSASGRWPNFAAWKRATSCSYPQQRGLPKGTFFDMRLPIVLLNTEVLARRGLATAGADRKYIIKDLGKPATMDIPADWTVSDDKFESLLNIILKRYNRPFENALVVGCGTGHEAVLLSQRLGCKVEGIDIIGIFFRAYQEPKVRLRVMDICKTDYETASFDFLYSFHALEHIVDLDAALAEMRRLLKPGGVFCVGTPNKSRIVGSLTTNESLKVKVLLNLHDWKMRLTNRWENSLGAHAGFTREHLQQICVDTFGEGIDITDEYYRNVYASRAGTIETIVKLRLGNWLFPGVYVLGARGES